MTRNWILFHMYKDNTKNAIMIADRLRTITTTIQLVLLNQFTGTKPSRNPQRLFNQKEKKEEIWLSPMTNALTPT